MPIGSTATGYMQYVQWETNEVTIHLIVTYFHHALLETNVSTCFKFCFMALFNS